MTNIYLTGASMPITLGGKTYDVSPLDDKRLAELDTFVRSEHIKAAAAASESLPPAQADRVISIAVEQASSITAMSPIGARILSTPRGVARILWVGIKSNHPDVKFEDVEKDIFSREAIQEANRIFNELNVKPLETLVPGKAKAARASKSNKRTSTKRSSKSTASRRRK